MEVIEGEKLTTQDKYESVINNAVDVREPKKRVGDGVVMGVGPGPQTFHVVGMTREASSPGAVGYVPIGAMQLVHPGMTNSLRIVLDKSDPDSITAVKEALDRNLEEQGVRARGSSSKADSRF